jgi:hypothetical protein
VSFLLSRIFGFPRCQGGDPPGLVAGEHIFKKNGSECMRRPVKQFELSGQHRDTNVRLGAFEVWLKGV